MKKNILLVVFAAMGGAILSVLAFLLLFRPADGPARLPSESQTEASTKATIDVETGIWLQKDWGNTYATYLGDMVPNEKVAVDIACGVLYGVNWGSTADNCVPWYVFLDVEDDIWIVAFKCLDKNNPDVEFLGGGYYVAIQKSDGRILRLYADQ